MPHVALKGMNCGNMADEAICVESTYNDPGGWAGGVVRGCE